MYILRPKVSIILSSKVREVSVNGLRRCCVLSCSPAIELSTTHQEYEKVFRKSEIKSHKKKVRKTKIVRYWGVIAIIDGRKIKVILRKIGDGQLHFWSIVPAWVTNTYRDIKLFSTMKGNPAED